MSYLDRDHMNENCRELHRKSMQWMDGLWDEEAGLVTTPVDPTRKPPYNHEVQHAPRSSAYYALGLLMREADGDVENACRALNAVIDCQYTDPGTIWYGTYKVASEEPDPPADALIWKDYDPNWREFIGCTFAILLSDFRNRMGEDLVDRLEASLRMAVEGSLERNVPASYSNIALMSAFLWNWAGDHFGNADWTERGERLAEQIHLEFSRQHAFEEYNSPTYYGVDLAALSFWKRLAPSGRIRAWGDRTWDVLWKDASRYYHAGLGNLCGPFLRSYGMDMREYGANIALWLWAALGREFSPHPEPAGVFPHAHDVFASPLAVWARPEMPEEAATHFRQFQGERQVEQLITEKPTLKATAWLSEQVMIGGLFGSLNTWDQLHPATVHWLCPDGSVGWIRLQARKGSSRRPATGIHALAGKGTLSAVLMDAGEGETPEAVFEIKAPGLDPVMIRDSRWGLPGLEIEVKTDAGNPVVEMQQGHLKVRYSPAEETLLKTMKFDLQIFGHPTSGASDNE